MIFSGASAIASVAGAAACLAVAAMPCDAQTISGRAVVIEGDLIEIDATRIRLWGVDSPEPAQECYRPDVVWACGQAAIDHLRAFVGNSEVSCAVQTTDAVGTVHAKCRVMGLDLSADLASHGLALVPRDGPQDYILNHHDGRTHTAGLWGAIYVTPWDWRAGRRVLEWITDERGCSVKGDLGEGGERIYYLPNQPAFQEVRIETHLGERWFCSAEDAEAAGWRAYGG